MADEIETGAPPMTPPLGSSPAAEAAHETALPVTIAWTNLWWVAAALLIMIAAIASGDYAVLNFVHVLTGVIWTGIDIFAGFVLAPVVRRVDAHTRRHFATRLMPKMLFVMTTLSIIVPTTGWYLAEWKGYLALPFPQYWWVVAALGITTILGVQGLAVLLPVNLRICFELAKARPDMARAGPWIRRYGRAVAFQAAAQIVLIFIMSHFATGI